MFDTLYLATMQEAGLYRDGTKAIKITGHDGEPLATVTCCLDSGADILLPNEYLIKTYSENREVSAALLKAKFFEDTGKRIPSGFVEIEVWKITERGLAEFAQMEYLDIEFPKPQGDSNV